MYLHAIIFKKLENVFNQLNSSSNQYYITFTPVSTAFTNTEFNFLDPDVSGSALSESIENSMAFAYFANAIIRNPKIYTLTVEDFLQNSYKKIFENALLIDSSISDTEKQNYKEARTMLFINDNLDPTPEYAKYLTYSNKYNDITSQLSTLAESLMSSPADANILSQQQALLTRQNIIFNDWLIEGEKEKIEKALKTVQNLNKRSVFVNQWNSEYNLLRTNLQNITTVNSNFEFMPVSCLPNNIYDYTYHGWKKIVLDEDEINSLTEEAKNYLGESFYNASDDGNPNANKIEFEYIFVSILRNWFKPSLINSNYWTFANDSTETVSSDNDLSTGLMPSYIDKFIYIRRVCAYNKITASSPETPIAETSFKVLRFKDIAKLKKLNEVKTVAPVEAPTAKLRMISTDTPMIKPILLRKSFSGKTTMREIDRSSIFLTAAAVPVTPVAAPPAAESGLAAGRISRRAGLLHANFADRRLILNPTTGTPDPPRTHFNLTLSFKDNLNNPLEGINTIVTHTLDGSTYTAETQDNGNIVLPNILKGDYKITIQNEEMFDDVEFSVTLTADMVKTMILKNRANPRFDMYLIGAINYRFPKLPNPLPDYTYS